jgi:MFS family permease
MFLAGAVFGAYQPVLPPYLKNLGFSEAQSSLALASINVAAMISPLLVGQAADRWIASERLLAILNVVCGAVLLLVGQVTGFVPFLAAFFVAMLLTVPLFSMATSIALQNLPDGARDFPAIRACGTFGHVCGANLLSGWLMLTHRSFSDALILSGLIAFVSAGVALTLPHTPPRQDPAGRSAIGRAAGMLRDPGFALFIGLMFLVQLFGTAYYARGPVFLLDAGFSKERLSSLMSIGLYGRIGAKGTIALGLAAWALRFACWSQGSAPWLLLMAIGLHGICFACGRIAATIYVDRVCPRDARASAQGLLSLLVDGSGAVLGNLMIGGLVTHYTVHGAPVWSSIWLVPTVGLSVVLVAFLLGFREKSNSFAESPEPSPKAPV